MKRYREEEKAGWLDGWKGSGKKAWAYARENGLNPQTFSKWAKKETGATPRFVELKPRLAEGGWHRAEILIEKGEVRIHLPLGITGPELRTVMESLGCKL